LIIGLGGLFLGFNLIWEVGETFFPTFFLEEGELTFNFLVSQEGGFGRFYILRKGNHGFSSYLQFFFQKGLLFLFQEELQLLR